VSGRRSLGLGMWRGVVNVLVRRADCVKQGSEMTRWALPLAQRGIKTLEEGQGSLDLPRGGETRRSVIKGDFAQSLSLSPGRHGHLFPSGYPAFQHH